MAARLKLKIQESPVCYENTDTPYLTVSVEYQDGTLVERGGGHSKTEAAPNGLNITSASHPDYAWPSLYIRGSSRGMDDNTFRIPISEMGKVIDGVRWFNQQKKVDASDTKLAAFAAELRTLANKYA